MKAERLAKIRGRWLQMEMNEKDLAAFAERTIDPLFAHIAELETALKKCRAISVSISPYRLAQLLDTINEVLNES